MNQRFLVERQSLMKAIPDSDACVVVIDDDGSDPLEAGAPVRMG